jgi:hypothetical protein
MQPTKDAMKQRAAVIVSAVVLSGAPLHGQQAGGSAIATGTEEKGRRLGGTQTGFSGGKRLKRLPDLQLVRSCVHTYPAAQASSRLKE